MKYSLSFLGTIEKQLPLPGVYGNDAVEAILFTDKDLEERTWEETWKLIGKAVFLYGNENVSFHFPVKNSDYTNNPFVKERVKEALQRSNELGLRTMVIHSNQMATIEEWKKANLADRRKRVIHLLADIAEKYSTKTILTLENMPAMDNDGKIIDPLFVYPHDFLGLRGTKVKVVWDVCHYTNTVASVSQVIKGQQNRDFYPNLHNAGLLDFFKIKELIFHWHFSAFKGISNPETEDRTVEGFIPSKGTLGEETYDFIFKEILLHQSPDEHMVFEVQELDYGNRIEGEKIIRWAKEREI